MEQPLKPALTPTRRFVPQDFAAIKKLLEDALLPTEDLSADAMRHFLVMENADGIVACCGLEIFSESALLRSLAVASEFRGGGAGKVMVSAIESLAAENMVKGTYLLTETAEKFFASLGYERIDRNAAASEVQATAEFSHICPDSAVCMRKLL